MERLYYNIRTPCKGFVALNGPYIRPIRTNEVAVVCSVKILILFVELFNILACY